MKHVPNRITVSIIASVFLIACPVIADNLSLQNQEANLFEWSPVPDAKLSELRGGFVLGNGIIVDINFEKSIVQNGELVSHSYFQSPQDINLLSKDEFNLSSILPSSTLNTVLQNTLDNQTLSAITNIDITIKNLEQAQQAFIQAGRYNTYFDPRSY